jgi:uncharacterized protein (DUF885 family)
MAASISQVGLRGIMLSVIFFWGCAGGPTKEPNAGQRSGDVSDQVLRQSTTTEAEKNLQRVITTYSETNKRIDAFYAPYFNVTEDLDKFGDFLSPEMEMRRQAMVHSALTDLEGIDQRGLSDSWHLAYRLFKGSLELEKKSFAFPDEYFAYNQMGNRFRQYIDDSSPELTSFPFKTLDHYRAFAKRAEGFSAFVDRQIKVLVEGANAGYALNCTIAKASIATYKDALEPVVEKNPFYRPVLHLPDDISKQEQANLRAAYAAMIQNHILPAFQKFDRFFQKDYLPKCRKGFGLKGLPRADEMYRFAIESNVDIAMDPVEIHKVGLREVARIRGEMVRAFKALGYNAPIQESLKRITKDEKSYFKSADEMLKAYDVIGLRVASAVATDFNLIPKTDFKIVASENPEDAAGSYRDPTEFVPYGRFMFNSSNLKATPRWGTMTLFLHEAIPGHHFHLALQYEMKQRLTEYQRKMFYSNAFTEGWALYAEHWGREAGLLNDPAQMLGSLSDEMLRAVRLVVDTGIHYYGWSRTKAMNYMKENLPTDARDIQIEVDRYSVWPAQALGYKLGQLKILELRQLAKASLGPKFNIRDFHRVVLENGTVSIPVLQSNVARWIAKNKLN